MAFKRVLNELGACDNCRAQGRVDPATCNCRFHQVLRGSEGQNLLMGGCLCETWAADDGSAVQRERWETATQVMSSQDFYDSGLLTLINALVLWPRGLALAIQAADDEPDSVIPGSLHVRMTMPAETIGDTIPHRVLGQLTTFDDRRGLEIEDTNARRERGA